jgi:hypothetical protein
MRKVLIATIVAMVLFAVGAFAASFTLQAEDIASGNNDVKKCADAKVDFTGLTRANTVPADWTVGGATVTFAGTGCTNTGKVKVVVTGGPGDTNLFIAESGEGSLAPSNGNMAAPVTFTAPLPLVSQVKGSSVLLDGVTLTP